MEADQPAWYLERLRDRQTLLVYARYDLTFPVDLSEDLVRRSASADIPHEVAVLRCGHYSTGKAPFKFVDGWILTRFLKTVAFVGLMSGRPVTDISTIPAARRSSTCARSRTSGVTSPSLTASQP